MKCEKCGKDVNDVKIVTVDGQRVYHCLDCYVLLQECHFCHKTKPVKHAQWFSPWTSWYPDDDYGSTFYEKLTAYACSKCMKKLKLEPYVKDRKG